MARDGTQIVLVAASYIFSLDRSAPKRLASFYVISYRTMTVTSTMPYYSAIARRFVMLTIQTTFPLVRPPAAIGEPRGSHWWTYEPEVSAVIAVSALAKR